MDMAITFPKRAAEEKVMQIYWLVMSGLLLLPWSLIFAPALTLCYRRLSSRTQLIK